jgi:membrane-associated phospholipid phosphatase
MKMIENQPIKELQKKARRETFPLSERRRRTSLIRFILTVFAAGFAVLAYFARITPYFSFDLLITRAIQHNNNIFFSKLMLLVSYIGFPPQIYVFVLIIVLFLYALGIRWEAVVLLVNSISITGLNLLIKTIVHRPRPSVDLVRVVTKLSEYSFPSGHVMFYTSFFGFLLFLCYVLIKSKRSKIVLMSLCALLILLIGPSRVYLGAHWASDVFGAYLFGTLWLVFTIYAYDWGKKRFFVHQPIAPGQKQ